MATQAQVKAFIAQIGPIIQLYAKSMHFKTCSAIIAQACCESAYGTSSLGYKYHNYFGMKCGRSWKGASVNMTTKEEYTPGALTTIKDNFRAYGSIEEGVAGYFAFTNCSRYANLKDAKDYKEFAKLVKADGWATSSTYTNTLIKIVEQNGLQVWDNFDGSSVPAPQPAPQVTAPVYKVGKLYTTQVELNVRTGAGTNYPLKGYNGLSTDGKKHDKNKNGALDEGTVVTCQQLKTVGSAVWMKCPSGWICAFTGKEIYVK